MDMKHGVMEPWRQPIHLHEVTMHAYDFLAAHR
jgi:hypothetical protein